MRLCTTNMEESWDLEGPIGQYIASGNTRILEILFEVKKLFVENLNILKNLLVLFAPGRLSCSHLNYRTSNTPYIRRAGRLFSIKYKNQSLSRTIIQLQDDLKLIRQWPLKQSCRFKGQKYSCREITMPHQLCCTNKKTARILCTNINSTLTYSLCYQKEVFNFQLCLS